MMPTGFGWIFLPLALFAVLTRGNIMTALLAASTVIQAPAVFVIAVGGHGYGVTPFNVACACAFFGLLIERRTNLQRMKELSRDGFQNPLLMWMAFLLFSALCSLILPHVFSAVGVHPALKSGDVSQETVPLVFGMANIAAAINTLCVATMLIWFVLEGSRNKGDRTAVLTLAAPLIVSVLANLYQRGVYFGAYPLDFEFWGSNPSYNQSFHEPFYWLSFGRTALPFIEPSYAGAWFAATTIGSFSAFTFSKIGTGERRKWAIASMISLLCLLSTASTTGFMASALGLVMLIGWVYWHRNTFSNEPRRLTPLALALLALLVGGVMMLLDWYLFRSSLLLGFRELVSFNLAKLKTNQWALGPRLWSTQRALAIFAETWGLGVGNGSVRSSSFLATLLASSGLVGLTLFSAATWQLVRSLVAGVVRNPTVASLALLSLATSFASVFGAISDQLWPPMWLFVGTGLCFRASMDQELAKNKC
jgi:hypothetical protein